MSVLNKTVTTKELNKLSKQYIIDCIELDAYEEQMFGIEIRTDKEKLQFLYDTLKEEFICPANLRIYKTEQICFKNWIMGLPSVFNMAFTNYDILQIAIKWGSISDNATEKQEDYIIANWFSFIANKTFQLFRKHKII